MVIIARNVAGTSTKDRIGCIDSDGDGWSNPDSVWSINLGGDAFPDDATQHFDGDQDGYGDNAEGNQPDACPSVFGTSNMDLFGCRDSDGDEWSDAADVFNNDATQWSDQDGDGYGDETVGNHRTPARQNLATRRLLAMVVLIPMVTD